MPGRCAEFYLRHRGITDLDGIDQPALPSPLLLSSGQDSPTETWPALIAAVTDLDGRITGVHRTWLDPSGSDKAPIDTPRRAMGDLLGNAVRFGAADDVMAAGEGIETMLSVRSVMPTMPMVGSTLGRASRRHPVSGNTAPSLYRSRQRSGRRRCGGRILIDRTQAAGIEAIVLSPWSGDFNEDLRRLDIEALRAAVRMQLAPDDVARFMRSDRIAGRGEAARLLPRMIVSVMLPLWRRGPRTRPS